MGTNSALALRMTDHIKSLVDFTVRGTESFVKSYYDVLNGAKAELHNFYALQSVAVWNGRTVDMGSLAMFFSKLPPATFKATTIDCQPVAYPMPGSDGVCAAANILVTVQGDVSYFGNEAHFPFMQVFVLAQDETKPGTCFYIASDCFREITREPA
eukprot:c48351_g1_i1.p2 GENE.c48351_g1_i1~~c48351_g1_i1.p2  ORF type:complete len:156 (-),score=31.62 c48351_g1_i1:241-708(-)